MPGLTMTDCSVADNVTQAKWEFDRAIATPDGFRDWALKWGAALLEVAAEHAGTESQADEDEIARLIDETKALRSAMREAIDALESA